MKVQWDSQIILFNKAYTNPGSYLTIDTCLINNKHVLLTKFKKKKILKTFSSSSVWFIDIPSFVQSDVAEAIKKQIKLYNPIITFSKIFLLGRNLNLLFINNKTTDWTQKLSDIK